MKEMHLIGKVLALAKSIHLQKPANAAFHSQFLMGPKPRLGGLRMQWWTTRETKLICEDLALAVVQSNPLLAAGDLSEFCDGLVEVLREALLDQELFDFDKVFFNPTPTL